MTLVSKDALPLPLSTALATESAVVTDSLPHPLKGILGTGLLTLRPTPRPRGDGFDGVVVRVVANGARSKLECACCPGVVAAGGPLRVGGGGEFCKIFSMYRCCRLAA